VGVGASGLNRQGAVEVGLAMYTFVHLFPFFLCMLFFIPFDVTLLADNPAFETFLEFFVIFLMAGMILAVERTVLAIALSMSITWLWVVYIIGFATHAVEWLLRRLIEQPKGVLAGISVLLVAIGAALKIFTK
jgi:hypothetical protein